MWENLYHFYSNKKIHANFFIALSYFYHFLIFRIEVKICSKIKLYSQKNSFKFRTRKGNKK